MLKRLFVLLKELFFPEPYQEMTPIGSEPRRSHPKYWQPLYIDGKYEYPDLNGLVTVPELCRNKSPVEIREMIKNCTDPKRRKLFYKELRKKSQGKN